MKKLSFFFMAAFLLSYSAASAQNATTILEKADSADQIGRASCRERV